jgi:hypothetical protein
VPLRTPEILHGVTWDRTRTSAVKGRRLTPRAMARPFKKIFHVINNTPFRTARWILCLSYRDQAVSAVLGNNSWLSWESHKIYMIALWW